VLCFIQRVNLVVYVKCWGEGISVGVWGKTSNARGLLFRPPQYLFRPPKNTKITFI